MNGLGSVFCGNHMTGLPRRLWGLEILMSPMNALLTTEAFLAFGQILNTHNHFLSCYIPNVEKLPHPQSWRVSSSIQYDFVFGHRCVYLYQAGSIQRAHEYRELSWKAEWSWRLKELLEDGHDGSLWAQWMSKTPSVQMQQSPKQKGKMMRAERNQSSWHFPKCWW